MSIDHWTPPLAIAHRGSRQLWPENTMEAFSGAVEMGYRYLETDLHVTADGVVVCFHDDDVDRTTDGSGPVSDYSFSDLKGLDAGYRHRSEEGHVFRGEGVRVPSLEEMATAFPEISIVLDLKIDGLTEPLAEQIGDLELENRVIVGSFSDERIAEFRNATDGRIPTSTGLILTRAWLLASRVGRGAGGEASALQVPTHLRGVRVVNPKLIETAHKYGMQVHVWTVNEPESMESLLDLGVDGIVTDRPDLLKEVLIARGQWEE